MSEHGIYCVWVDCGGISEIAAAFENKAEAIEYAAILVGEACKKPTANPDSTVQPFIMVDTCHDGAFFFKRDAITGVRVVPDIGKDGGDDDDDEEENPSDDPAPFAEEDFRAAMRS